MRLSRCSRFAPLAFIAASCLTLSITAKADEVSDLEEELALTIEDVNPTKQGSVDLNGAMRYQRLRPAARPGGRDEFQFTPRLQWGAARNFQLSLAAPYRVGNAPDTSQGELRLDALYKLNAESRFMPAFALSAGLERPYGSGSGGTEILLKGILTKSLGSVTEQSRPGQVHFNLLVRHNLNPDEEERRNRYLVGAAYSQALSERWLVATSVFREQQRERGDAINMAEVGVRWKLSEKTILSSAIGSGFNEGSPRWRLLFGFQRSME